MFLCIYERNNHLMRSPEVHFTGKRTYVELGYSNICLHCIIYNRVYLITHIITLHAYGGNT